MRIVVLGMHRSGTSAVAGLLEALGCHLGAPEDLHPADEWNPQGYGERRDVWALDERILQAAGGCWHDVGALDLDRLEPGERSSLEREAAAIVERLDERAVWAIKDPRLCLTFPIWRPALADAVVVLALRDPREVALSLRRRDGLPLLAGIALWERYLRDALRHSAGLPRVLVCYEDLCADPETGAAALLAGLRRAGLPEGSLALRPRHELPVDPSLRHERCQDGSGWLVPAQRELLERARTGEPFEVGPVSELAADLLETLGALRRRDVAGVRLLEEIVADKDRWIADLQQRLDLELPRLLEMLAEKDRWIADLQRRLDATTSPTPACEP